MNFLLFSKLAPLNERPLWLDYMEALNRHLDNKYNGTAQGDDKLESLIDWICSKEGELCARRHEMKRRFSLVLIEQKAPL